MSKFCSHSKCMDSMLVRFSLKFSRGDFHSSLSERGEQRNPMAIVVRPRTIVIDYRIRCIKQVVERCKASLVSCST